MNYKRFSEIKGFRTWKVIQPITKGWSNDQKYYIEDSTGLNYLLRTTNISEYARKQKEFEYLQSISKLGLTASEPVDFGICADGTEVYQLLSWVEGDDAETALINYSGSEQYKYGLLGGQMLRKIHSINAPEGEVAWAKKYTEKIRIKRLKYEACPIKCNNDTKFLEFINHNLSGLEDRKQTFQHGDFHVGNLLLNNCEIGVVDFNRMDFGDPWEEFNRIPFSQQISNPFAVGQIHGYFESNPPNEFFRLMALYIAANALFSIPWAVPFGDADVNKMLRQAQTVYEHYCGFTTTVPVWYEQMVS